MPRKPSPVSLDPKEAEDAEEEETEEGQDSNGGTESQSQPRRQWAESWLQSQLELGAQGSVARNLLYENYCKCYHQSATGGQEPAPISLRETPSTESTEELSAADDYEMHREGSETQQQPISKKILFELIRQLFPEVTCRRLGNRGQTKYYFCGLQWKTVPPFQSVDSTQSAQSSASTFIMTLPAFPLTTRTSEQTMHAQDCLQTHLQAYQNFMFELKEGRYEEAVDRLQFYWANRSAVQRDLLVNSMDALTRWEIFFHHHIALWLIPNPLFALDAKRRTELRNFSKHYINTMTEQHALWEYPDVFSRQRLNVVALFCSKIRRLTTLNHLTLYLSQLLSNANNQLSVMFNDCKDIRITAICDQLFWLKDDDKAFIYDAWAEFTSLLYTDAQSQMQSLPLLRLTSWLDQVTQSVLSNINSSLKHPVSIKRIIKNVITSWSFLNSLILRDLTLRSASSFDMFHLLKMFCEEYVFHLLDNVVSMQELSQMYPQPVSTHPQPQHQPHPTADPHKLSPPSQQQHMIRNSSFGDSILNSSLFRVLQQTSSDPHQNVNGQ